MLYVFLVDTGTMLTFDMNLAMESVSKLMHEIASQYHITEDKQVLLISGGENLDVGARVCSYSSGTDTNPIFLFSKSTIEAATPPSPSINYGSDADLHDQVEGSHHLPPTYGTVVARAQLALQFNDVAKDEMRTCEHLVHDQHLQHQGWAAVVANLEDIASAFKTRSEIFDRNFNDYLKQRQHYKDILSSFHNDLVLLSKVPLLSCLTNESSAVEADGDLETPCLPQTLLEWVSAQDKKSNLEQMYEQCMKDIDLLDSQAHEQLMTDITQLIDAINNPNMKEVKGLEDRLFGLEQLMFGARKVVKEQGEMAQGFVQNQNRASNLRDTSVLPDLCESHKKQLTVMLKNHQQLKDIRRRCSLAKEELSGNLHKRLRWIMYVEKQVCDIDNKLVIHHENLKKTRRKLEIIKQMHDAPNVYVSAVKEVVRRKWFSTNFLEWAKRLSKGANEVYLEEVGRRQKFGQYLKHHFLQSLFPGIEDSPPQYASITPEPFDHHLPNITQDDITYLKEKVPEFADSLSENGDTDTNYKKLFETYKDPSDQADFCLDMDNMKSDIIVLHGDQDDFEAIENSAIATSTITTKQIDDAHVQLTSDQNQPVSSDFTILTSEHKGSKSVEVLADPGSSILIAQDLIANSPIEELKSLDINVHSTELAASPQTDDEQYMTTAFEHVDKPAVESTKDKAKIIKQKSPNEQSPDVESLGQDFQTADFYIDESMPSSMTESNSRRVAELQKAVQEKSSQVEAAEKEILEMRQKLEQVEEKLRLLHDLSEKSSLKLHCDVLSIEKQLQKDTDDFNTFMEHTSTQIIQAITNVEAREAELRRKTLEDVQAQHKSELQKITNDLDLKSGKLEDTERELQSYHEKLNELNEKFENIVVEKEDEIKELAKKYKTELDELSQKLTLEHEIDLDKIRTDFTRDLEIKDNDLKHLTDDLKESQEKVEEMKKENENIKSELEDKFKTEKEDIISNLNSEHNTKLERVLEETRSSMHKAHEDELQSIVAKHNADIESKCSNLTTLLNKECEEALSKQQETLSEEYKKQTETLVKELELNHQNEIEEIKENLLKEKESELAKVKDELKELQVELEELKSRQVKDFEDKETATSSETDEKFAMRQFETEKALAVSQAIDELKAEHKKDIDHLVETMEKDKQDTLNSMKSSSVAEKQVAFNEAIAKVNAEKVKAVEELQKKLNEATYELTQLKSGQGNSKMKDEATGIPQTSMSGAVMSASMMSGSVMSASVMPISESSSDTRIQELQQALKTKDDELLKLNSKVMELSMSTSTRSMVTQDKVSITSCNVGDIVLLCLDERHDHYVVFSVGVTLHFLHSECLEALGLKIQPNEPRKSWVLGEIVDKEYCQAKKAQNRFKVPMGTKFYRVKAKPWVHDRGTT
ncbi:unnamed protein product [Owenia fusiformis]|uniref:RB1-inducible coiled-coil protein 1 n=1 Tax=Owenia fusiformis TaxID=6347 RepID=A0A8S4MZH3_OWEFU|nr:unnamed protein product [Owenia fusiformis]